MKLFFLSILYILPLTVLCQKPGPPQNLVSTFSKNDRKRNLSFGLRAELKGGKWGFVNAKGKEIIPFVYEEASDFIEGNAVVKLEKWIQIDTLGNVIKEVIQRYAERFLPPKESSISQLTFNKHNIASYSRNINIQPNVIGQCPPNIDFEMGSFINWFCYTGRVSNNSQGGNVITYYNNNPPVNSPVNGRHTIVQTTTPTALDYYGQFPLNAPDGSGNVIKLGNDFVRDSAEKVRYVIQVPAIATDYSITFQYAVVLENPISPIHTPDEKPRMLARVIDAVTGNILQCADFLYVAAGSIPGFYNSPVDPNVKCKSWTPVFVNLSAYAGKTLYLDFMTADCTLGAHFGYAYIDVGPCNQAISVQSQCNAPNITTLSGPPGFQFYNWWNDNFTTLLGTTQNLSLNPGPPLNSLIRLEVIPYNGIACKDTLTAQVIRTYPVADAGPDKGICSFSNVSIGSPPVAGYTYQWTPALYLNNAQISNPISATPVPITYTLTVTNLEGCSKQDSMVISVNPKPVAGFSVNRSSQCLNANAFLFTNSSTINVGMLYSNWNFGDGNSSSLSSPTHSYVNAGNYNVKLIVTSTNGCRDSIIMLITVYPTPNINFSINSNNQCINTNNFTFTNSSTIPNGTLSYTWGFGDGSSSLLPTVSHNYLAPGNYIVKLTSISSSGCKDSLSQNITVNINPIISINANQSLTLCRNNSAQLIASGGESYQWTPSNGLSCNNCANPVASPIVNTTYVVRGINSSGCPGYDTLAVTVMQPIHIMSAGDTICIGDTTNLLVSGATNYVWSPPVGLNSTIISNPKAYPTVNTTYRIVGYDGANCFTDTAFIKISVGQKLGLSLGDDVTLATGSLYNFNPIIINGPVLSWLWTPQVNLSCYNCPFPVATVKNDINYKVSVKDIYGCTATDRITINTFCKNSQIFIPNAFTPDGNGINDMLMIRAKGVIKVKYFRIFNRWGELVFEKFDFPPNNPQFGWNGKIKGVVGPPDVFVYTAEVVCENGNSYIFKGNTSIIR